MNFENGVVNDALGGAVITDLVSATTVTGGKFGTKAIFTITLILFGTISVFYNLYKLYGGDEATHKH
jgi:hypothetical protein